MFLILLTNVTKLSVLEIIYSLYTLYICKYKAKVEEMAALASSNLDKQLAELYSETVTVNVENLDQKTSKLSPDDFWKSMQVIATNNKAFIKISKK